MNLKNHPLLPYISVILAMLLWGMSFVWTAVVLEYYKPVTVIFLRLSISALFMFFFLKSTRKWVVIERKDRLLFFTSALFNPFLYFLGENYGVLLTSPTISAVVIATIPLFVPIGGVLILKEKMPLLTGAGLLVSFTGVLVMLLNRNLQFDAQQAGVGALFGAVASAVIYTILLKKLSHNYPPFFIIAVQNIIGVVLFLPLFLTFDLTHFLSVRPDAKAVISLIALALFCSSLAFVFFTIAMRDLGVNRANIFSNLIPVFTALFSWFLVDEIIGSQKIAGILFVVTGLMIAQSKPLLQFINRKKVKR
ncbi:MAG: DMT family transporter [Bacteroidales bacterium]